MVALSYRLQNEIKRFEFRLSLIDTRMTRLSSATVTRTKGPMTAAPYSSPAQVTLKLRHPSQNPVLTGKK